MAVPLPHRALLLHRAEHALFGVALAAALAFAVVGRSDSGWGTVLFWAIAPDLVFLPIALADGGRRWPPWGAALYNATHTYLVMLPAFALASLAQGRVAWPLLAWAAHIEVDRASGLDLRADAHDARDASPA